jgi:hypothetical protein
VRVVLVVSVDHVGGPVAVDERVRAEIERQLRGLGPIRVDTPNGGASFWRVVDVLAEVAL